MSDVESFFTSSSLPGSKVNWLPYCQLTLQLFKQNVIIKETLHVNVCHILQDLNLLTDQDLLPLLFEQQASAETVWNDKSPNKKGDSFNVLFMKK